LCSDFESPTFSAGTTAVEIAQFGQGTGPIFLDGIRCTGIEDRLVGCDHNEIGVHNCTQSQHAGVVCPSKQHCIMWFNSVSSENSEFASGIAEGILPRQYDTGGT